MNLASTIEIYGGGPGSGCQGPNCGRPEGSVPKEVTDYVNGHATAFQRSVELIKQALLGESGQLQFRMKTPESVHSKMQTTGKALTDIHDVIGLRVTVKTVQDVYNTVSRLTTTFCAAGFSCKMDDKLKNPKGPYRAFHLDATVAGKPIEIQIRTENESKLAHWMHNTYYKGPYKGDPLIEKYTTKLSMALYRQDQGLQTRIPPCPPAVAAKVGCFNAG